MTKPIKAWAGMVDERFDSGWYINGVSPTNYEPNLLGLFKTKKDARARYKLVIPVLISPIKPAKH